MADHKPWNVFVTDDETTWPVEMSVFYKIFDKKGTVSDAQSFDRDWWKTAEAVAWRQE